MLAALLALAASVSWGSSDFLGGLQSRRTSVWSVNAVSQPAALLSAVLIVIVAGGPMPSPAEMVAPFLGGFAAVLALLSYYHALTLGKMSIVAPIVAAAAAVPVIVGLVRGERPSTLQLVGMVLAVAGIVVISRAHDDRRRRVSLASVLFALAASLGFGLMLVTLDIGGDADPYWSVLEVRVASLAFIVGYVLIRRPPLRLSWQAAPAMAASGVLLVAANTLFTVASTLGFLSVVAVLSSLSPVTTAALARGFLGERLTTPQWAAAATVLAGVVCLAAG